jgi:hypothetical protein
VNKLVIYILICFTTGCNQKNILNAHQLAEWFQDTKNGYRVVKNSNQYTFDLQLRPILYEKALSIINNYNNDEEILNDDLSYYFTLKIKHHSGSDISTINTQNQMDKIEKNLYYLSYIMEDDVFLVQGNDTIKPLYFIYEKPYNLSKYSTFNFCFTLENIKEKSDIVFVIDGGFFNTLPVKFKFSKEDIYNHPKLKNS